MIIIDILIFKNCNFFSIFETAGQIFMKIVLCVLHLILNIFVYFFKEFINWFFKDLS